MAFLRELIIPALTGVFLLAYFIDVQGLPIQSQIFPFTLMVAMVLVAIPLAIREYKRIGGVGVPAKPLEGRPDGPRRIFALFTMSIGYVILWAVIGFLPATVLFLIASMATFGVSWIRAALIGLILTALMYGLFQELFLVQLVG